MKSIPLVPPETQEPEDPSARADAAPTVPDATTTDALKPKIVDAISTVYDPEIPVNIWELGLIYDIAVDQAGVASIRMTLTAPGCPAAQSLPVEVAEKVKAVPGVSDANVEIVWEPPWSKDRMSDAAKLQLGMW
jgi:FeS assembly SUF system protein